MSGDDSASNPQASKPKIRIDAAHRMATAKVDSMPSPQCTPVAAAVSGETAEQLQLHAGQLARHLQDRRRDADHREAQLNARIAQLENELRLSRLWMREQSEDFARKEAEIREQISDHESRAAAIAAGELALDESRRQFAAESRFREDLVARRETQVLESQQRLAQEATRLQGLREQIELQRQQLEREKVEQLCQTQAADIQQLERLHQHYVLEWKQERAQLQQQLQHRQDELDAEKEAFAQRVKRWDEEREQYQQSIENDRKQVQERQVTLERVRGEVLRLHREALEMRLVAEQLWAQLAGKCTPAELTAGVARLRNQLADEFRFAHRELEVRRTSLTTLIERLDQKQHELAEQRNELLDWFRRRQTDLAQKAIELSQRHQQFLMERQQFRDAMIEAQELRFESQRPTPIQTRSAA